MPIVNREGQRFGRLVAIKPVGRRRGAVIWECQCDCGNKHEVVGYNLPSGRIRSCGCLQKELLRARLLTHGRFEHPLYDTWQGMMARCYDTQCPKYHNYGGRGILVAARWHDINAFIIDMGEKGDRLTLERINNDGPYAPDNCRWATRKEQAINTRRTVFLTLDGVTKPIVTWAAEYQIGVITVKHRLKRGWPVSELFTPPVDSRGRRRAIIDGRVRCIERDTPKGESK